MKKLYAGTVLVLLLAGAAELWANPQIFSRRWQSKAGWTYVDSLGWRARGGRYLNSTVDTLTAAGVDTSCAYPIDGADYISLSVWNKKVVIGGTVTYTVQVADDTLHWTTLSSSFSMACTSTGRADTTATRALFARVGGDSSYSGFGQAIDRRRISAASYLRVIATLGTHGGTDTTIHCATLKVRYPRDPKTR